MGIADRVRFLGERFDVPRLLAAADVHCQPNSGPEPFGIAFIEALYASLPVVSTRIGARPRSSTGRAVSWSPRTTPRAGGGVGGVDRRPRSAAPPGAAGPAQAHRLCDPAAALAAWRNYCVKIPTAKPPRIPEEMSNSKLNDKYV